MYQIEILGVNRSASQSEIKSAYWHLVGMENGDANRLRKVGQSFGEIIRYLSNDVGERMKYWLISS
jgi:DnaJ-class molecular chaperone